MSHDPGDEQREKDVCVVGQLKGKNDAGERGSHGAGENGAHADERPETRAEIGKHKGLQTTERPAHHQQRSQNAARCARTKRNGPDEPFHEENTENDFRGDTALQESANGVVANPKGSRKYETAEANGQAADSRPPHPMEFQFQECIFRGVYRESEESGKSAG